ncbi:MAG: hypothetical protein HXY39_11275 [Chloroflexi bacterium]|nr:hypothetical protein [Chloroflexota bacterium]
MMAQQQQTFPWGAVLWSALLLVVIPVALSIAVGVGHGVIVGFETRGDPVAINAAVVALASQSWYRALPKVIRALVALWRGARLARSGVPVMHLVGGVALLALALDLALGLTLFGAMLDVELAISVAVDAVVIVAFGFLGARLAERVAQ